MKNEFRLSSKAFQRETDAEKVEPQKIIFLSVEGNVTEREYFEGISRNRKRLGINALIDVQVLRRHSKDTNSAPKQVIELLEEYLQLRDSGKASILNDIPKKIVHEYGSDFVKRYLEGDKGITKSERVRFTTDLSKIGYDLEYRKYLSKYNSDLDEFAILIDRDLHTHSESNMRDCIKYCFERHYDCYIVNPCFEFWLLLHLCDVNTEYAEMMDEIQMNSKVSGNHTFVSREVSLRAHHGKSNIGFETNYLPFIDSAIERARVFASDEEELIDNVGTNVWKLLEKMKAFSRLQG